MTDASLAVFLSYASQDAEVAERICVALVIDGTSETTADVPETFHSAESDAIVAKLAASTDKGLLAMLYAQRADKDRALGLLENALQERDPYLEYVKVNRFLDPLRKEPRFQAVERPLQFPD